MKGKRIALQAVLAAVALGIYVLEAQIPASPIPGIKLGLANIVTLFALFVIGRREALEILTVRIFLGAVCSGHFASVFYSAAGGLLSWLAAAGLRNVLEQKQIWISGLLCAIAHCVGQMIVAVLVSGTDGTLVFLPVMVICAVFTGLFTGLCTQVLVNRGEKLWKTFLN